MKQYTLDDIISIQIDEPTIKPHKIVIPNKEKGEEQIKKEYNSFYGDESAFYSYLPLIEINKGFRVLQSNIINFKLNFTKFMPTLDLRIADPNAELKSKYYPTDGSIISIFISPYGNDSYYKCIRLDFIITMVSEVSSIRGSVISESVSEFILRGELNVPELFYNRNSYECGTSWESLRSISKQIGLGFVSNINNTNDSQLWLNGYKSIRSFIENISLHSYLDNESFFVSFIDSYYNLNFIEVSRLYSQFQENEKCWCYNTTFYGEDNSEEMSKNDTINEDEEVLNEWVGRRHKWWYELNNSRYLSAWTLYFDNYSEKNNSTSTLYDGYAKYIQSWDWDKREKVEERISVINHNTDGMLPLNKGKLVNGEPTELSKNMISWEYLGETNEHMHNSYYLAEANNTLNISDMDKFGLVVDLPCINPSIVRYSRIKVIVFEKNDLAQMGLTENPKMRSDSSFIKNNGEQIELVNYPELQSDTTPRFDLSTDEGIEQSKKLGIYSELATNGSMNLYNESRETINESLSGWYVVNGYDIYYEPNDEDNGNKLKQRVYLSRREYKPALKSDYEKVTNDTINS